MKKILSLLMVLSFVVVKAQNVPPKLNNSMIPPSPDAASLGKYGVFPVTLYTGSPNISIPIAEVSTNKIKLPISLSYNYNGYRLSEEASSIGMGWALQAGGVITRMVKGRTDDENGLTNKWYDVPSLPYIAENPDLLTRQAQNTVDSEPDIYTFSFNGYSGKFVLIKHRAFLFPKQDLVITENGGGFYVHTPDGAIYNFSTSETTDPVNSNNPSALQPYQSSWYLTNIRYEHSNEYIQFTYTDWQQRQRSGPISESLTKKTGYNSAQDCRPIPCFSQSSTSMAGSLIYAKRIATVSSPNILVKFIPGTTPRMDIEGNNSSQVYAISTIEIYNKPNNELIKKIALEQDYFGNNVNPAIHDSHLKLKSVQTTGYKYKKENGQTITETLQEPPHIFSYINEQAAYPKSGRSLDRWGYYNGASNITLFGSDIPENFPTIPMGDREVHVDYLKNGILEKITYPTKGYSVFEYENNIIRLPQFGDYIPVPKYTSTTITNPNPSNPSNIDSSMGGKSFRINTSQNITVTIGRTLIPPSTIYSIGTRRIFKLYWLDPQYEWDDPNAPAPTLYYISGGWGQGELSEAILDPIALIPGNYKYIVTCNHNWGSAYAHFSYQGVEPYLGSPGPGMRISAIKSFDNIDNSEPKTVKQYSYGNGAKPLNFAQGYGTVQPTMLKTVCLEEYEIITYNAEYSSSLYTIYNEQFFYPIVTEVNSSATNGRTVYEYNGTSDIYGVNLIAQTDFKVGIKVREIFNEYGDPFSGTKSIHFWGLTYRLTNKNIPPVNICWDPICCGPPWPWPQQYLSSHPQDIVANREELYAADSYVMWSIPNLQLSKIEKVYDDSQINPNTTTTTYSYESQNHLNPTKIVVNNSKGQIITTQIKYPLDYNILGCTSLNTMDNTFKQDRITQSQYFITKKTERYNHANELIYGIPPMPPNPPGPGYVNNHQNNALLTYLAANNHELNYKNDYASTLNWIDMSGINAYACYNPTNYPNANGAIINMQRFNNQTPIEKIVYSTENGINYLQGATKTDYSLFNANGGFWTQPKTIYTTEVQPNTVLLNGFNSTYYKPKIDFKFNNTSLIEQSKNNDVKMAYVWDYNDNYAIAEVVNAATEDIAATSFEANSMGGFYFSGIPSDDAETVTGTKYYNLSLGNISKSGLTTSKTYTVSYWGQAAKLVNGTAPTVTGRTINYYTYYEHQVNNTTAITISGNGRIDEVRLYPANALMTTYTYQPLVGVTTKCDANNMLLYYTYDALGRLQYVRDQDNNILKKLCYNYAGQQENCTDCTNYSPNWQNITPAEYRCQQGSCGNNGIQEQKQMDINICSPTYQSINWNPIGSNPSACPIQTCVQLTSTMVIAASNYLATYTLTSNPSIAYTFNVTNQTGLQNLGTIPAGNYTLWIRRTTSNSYALFKSGCWKQTVTDVEATFYNVNVSTATCNSITIDLGAGQ